MSVVKDIYDVAKDLFSVAKELNNIPMTEKALELMEMIHGIKVENRELKDKVDNLKREMEKAKNYEENMILNSEGTFCLKNEKDSGLVLYYCLNCWRNDSKLYRIDPTYDTCTRCKCLLGN